MDFILEGFDTFVFDYPYAKIFPAVNAAFRANATSSSLKEATTAYQPVAWHYEPSSAYLSLPPSRYAYETSLPRDDWRRQIFTLFLITWLFGMVIYFVFAGLSYVFIFDKATFNHPRYLKNQIRLEIKQTMEALPIMAIFTAPWFLLEVRGYSRMYDQTAEGPGLWYNFFQFPLFICFTDFCIYYIHRGLHHPLIYKQLHKAHHKWIMPTPFASHAFHPMDGYAQGLPYHIFPFIFPLQKFAYVFLFIFINIWTVVIHDGEYYAENPVINGAACHTMHHLYFNYNYGQFTTLWDRLGGSYRKPNDALFRKELKMCKEEWNKQSKAVDKMVEEVEGSDDRKYLPNEPKETKKVR
ncbi:hypothetical protein P154DRAFT_531475 [Amniculicola lignicola CBS 123094]|uniref:Fatty acid hydroxylase domain-containing protein n=1 Tax=Amniculicola lignicola CBS 123094 TaxID=1392246 RepID=A0A6A5WRN1_9PLEO|nr:hypothetical protein P154DRAFT_531475 [Amniculicola lignicola CBS 123094]